MNRRISMAAAGGALVAMILGNVIGASAAGPYVYGCATLNLPGMGGTETAVMTIYNGSATTANLTRKILSGNGTQLQAALGVASTATLGATKTSTTSWSVAHDTPSESSATVQNSVRIVSDVPVTVSIDIGGSNKQLNCMQLVP
jgi:hypothetical protein